MRRLTQDESERCHRALGYYIHAYPRAVQIMTSAGWQFKDTRCWMSPQGEPLTSVGCLPERPEYLFTMLFERLGSFTSDAPWGIQYSGKRMGRREGDYTAFVGEYTEENDHPCLSICAIIENCGGWVIKHVPPPHKGWTAEYDCEHCGLIDESEVEDEQP